MVKFKIFGFFAVVAIAMTAIVGFGVYRLTAGRQTVTCTVTDKDHTIASDKSGSHPVYRVYTTDCDVLNVEDNFFLGVFNSASIYGRIQPGHTYKFDTVGWRVPILSQFPDIASAVEVK